MPTYEYACKACDHNFEIVQSFSEDTLTTCPECEQDELRKVYNAAGIIFKGDGWHIKDYGNKKTSSSTTAASSGEGSGKDDSATSSAKDTSASKDAGTKKASGGDSASKSAAS